MRHVRRPARAPRPRSRDEALHWIGFTGLGGKEEVLPAGLNLHERKFLELARALAARPKLLLLDEVLSGLNPAEIDNAIRLVRAIRAQGATIVFVEHLMRAVRRAVRPRRRAERGQAHRAAASRARSCAIRASSASIWAKPMLLEARNLHVGYGDATAVWDVSLDVDAGEIVSVIGPNGAGKTHADQRHRRAAALPRAASCASTAPT